MRAGSIPSLAVRRAAVLAVALVAGGCSWIRPAIVGAEPTPIREVAPNTYELAKRGTLAVRRGSDLQIQAIEQASAFCQAKGRAMTLLDARSADATQEDQGSPGTFASTRIHFGCV